jgi:hypothetical protein
MFNDYLSLVRDCIAHFQEEWKLASPSAAPPPQKHVEVPMKKALPPLPMPPIKKVVVPEPKVVESSSQIRTLLQKCVPSVRLRESTLDDAAATRRMQAWQEYVGEVDVVLLAASQDKETIELIKNLAKTLVQKKGQRVKALSAERLEREKRWDLFLSKNQPQLLIASAKLTQMQHAMSFYKQNTATGEASLGGIPLLVLSASYEKQEKIALWNTLCQHLK